MARKAKYIKHSFDDGEFEFPSVIKVKCSVTGEECKVYYKQALKIIREQYGNEFNRFMDEYVSQKGKREEKDQNILDIDEDRPKLYANVLKLQWSAETDQSKKQHLAETYNRRYGEKISV